MNLTSFHKTVNNTASESAGMAIYTPDLDDEEIIVKITSLTGKAYGTKAPTDYSYFIAEEIGRAITIDPLEYANSESGIEDTPVGEIITKIGSTIPAHYLPCDGAIYNILDYPKLAQCIKDEFGSTNYYGGDGITTFGVPNKNTYNWWTPGLVNGVVPSPYAVYVSSVFNTTEYQKELLFDGIISTDSCWHSKADGSDTDIWVKFDFGKDTYIQGLRMAARSSNYLTQLPSTFTIEGSYDDVTYTVIKSYSRLPSPTSTNFREHLFDKPVNYRYYKLNHMTSNAKNNSYDYCSIAELEFSKVDNIQYIKAEPTYFMKNTYNPDNAYSADETIVGYWIDGKPIYRKVETISISKSSTDVNLSSLNIKGFISIKGYFTNGTETSSFPYLTLNSTDYAVSAFYANGYLQIRFGSSVAPTLLPCTVYAVIEYTKTTD